ncbi:MAG: hypothetical protein ABI442_02915 [Gemmatimonadaceae bacterium]
MNIKVLVFATALNTIWLAGVLPAQEHHLGSDSASANCKSSGSTATSPMDGSAMDHANMDHAAHLAAMRHCKPLPTMPGQAAFGAIGEVVRLLEADPSTDWSRVNIEALRQHLIDMDDVTMHAVVKQHNVAGGVDLDVSGTGRTVLAIRRMVTNHARMLDQGGDYRASVAQTPAGVRLTVTARNASDAGIVARIRGLGFAGILTEGDHHPAHHLAIARGDADAHGK